MSRKITWAHTKPRTNRRLRALRLAVGPVLWTLASLGSAFALIGNGWARDHLSHVSALWLAGLLFGAADAAIVRRATLRLLRRAERYRRLFDQGHDPTLVFGCLSDGCFGQVMQVNEALCELIGAPRESILGRPAAELFSEMGPELQRAVSQSVERRGKVALGANLLEADGSTVPIEAEFERFDTDDGTAIVVRAAGLRDASSVERALRRRSRQLAVLSSATRRLNEELDMPTVLEHLVQAAMEVASATSAVAGLAEGDHIVLRAHGAKGDHPRVVTTLKRGEGIAGHVWETMAPYVSNDVPRDPHTRDLSEGDVISVVALPIVDRHSTLLGYLEVHDRADGRPFDEEDTLILVGLAASAAIAIDNARTLDELVDARLALLADRMRCRSLAAELSTVSERERRAIASELHDQLGQLLAIARMKLKQAAAGDAPPEVAEACALLEQAVTETRSLTFQLSPPLLYELGLGAAIEWLTEETERRHGVLTSCQAEPLPEGMPDDVRALLYVCTRELILNAIKHAEASRIEVSVGYVDGLVRTVVRDDGKGFDPAEVRETISTYGLFSVGERLSGFGGVLEVRSAPGSGTTAILDVPFRCEDVEQRAAEAG